MRTVCGIGLLSNKDTAGRWIYGLCILSLDKSVASKFAVGAVQDMILVLERRLVLVALRLSIQRGVGSGLFAAAGTRAPVIVHDARRLGGAENARMASWGRLEGVIASTATLADKWWGVAAVASALLHETLEVAYRLELGE